MATNVFSNWGYDILSSLGECIKSCKKIKRGVFSFFNQTRICEYMVRKKMRFPESENEIPITE